MRVLATTDIIALVCILWGYLKGFIPALFGILGVVVGYATMIVLSRPLGDAVAGLGVLPPELAKFVSGAGISPEAFWKSPDDVCSAISSCLCRPIASLPMSQLE